MKIDENSVVSIDYKLTNNSGEVLDQSSSGDPLVYLHGHGNIIPGLEDALLGKAAGDAFSVKIEPADAYGEFEDSLVQEVPQEQFATIPDLQVGQSVQAQTDQGVVVFMVKKIENNLVTVDANHPLAGETLNFDVKVVEVRAASKEEISHGHVHGPGGHHH